MKKRKPNEFDKKMINNYLENLIKWQLESAKNIQEQYFGIQASSFVVTYVHDLGMYVMSNNLDIDPDEWEDMYIKASDKARKEFFEGGK